MCLPIGYLGFTVSDPDQVLIKKLGAVFLKGWIRYDLDRFRLVPWNRTIDCYTAIS